MLSKVVGLKLLVYTNVSAKHDFAQYLLGDGWSRLYFLLSCLRTYC